MAHIVVVTYAFDRFYRPKLIGGTRTSSYMLFDVLCEMESRGHTVRVISGLQERACGDCAILHLDSTLTPAEYLAFVRSFEKVINVNVIDISKRAVSGALLQPGDSWDGPVIVKSDLNCKGYPEAAHNERARKQALPLPHPDLQICTEYRIFDNVEALPSDIWSDPRLVVERFIPERDADGFALRTWVFMGERERCTRHVSRQRIVKGRDIVHWKPVSVPDELRDQRAKLGFDYGKFDFVIHEGRAVLLDANKTPGSARALRQFVADGTRNLADGLERLLK